MLFRSICFFILVSFFLTGCACLKPKYIRKRETAYLACCETPCLQVPPGFCNLGIGDDYPIPPALGPRPDAPVDITPPGLRDCQ